MKQEEKFQFMPVTVAINPKDVTNHAEAAYL